jgi:hypothetical protein
MLNSSTESKSAERRPRIQDEEEHKKTVRSIELEVSRSRFKIFIQMK